MTERKKAIPCLTSSHYIRGSSRVTSSTPRLTKAHVNDDDGSFDFRWKARGSNGESYALSARGPSANRLIVKCECVSFVRDQERLIQESEDGDVFVCKHLASALDSVCEADEDEDAEDDMVIPGLTEHHYFRGSNRGTPFTPQLLRNTVDSNTGDFNFEWEIRGSGGETYEVTAEGNIRKRQRETKYGRQGWWGFTAHCTCPNFEQQDWETQKSGWTRNYVCKHLAAALDSVVDGDASLSDYRA